MLHYRLQVNATKFSSDHQTPKTNPSLHNLLKPSPQSCLLTLKNSFAITSTLFMMRNPSLRVGILKPNHIFLVNLLVGTKNFSPRNGGSTKKKGEGHAKGTPRSWRTIHSKHNTS